MSTAAHHESDFSLRQARSIVKDCFKPNPWIYWTDFLLTMQLGNICFLWCRGRLAEQLGEAWLLPMTSPLFYLVFLVQCLAYYRAALFIHELVHLPRNKFNMFRLVWNLGCGVPFLTPSFIYYPHIDHHRRKHYGTEHDGEYLPLGCSPLRETIKFLSYSLIIPALAIVRFGVLSPISWVSPRFRDWVHRHASSLVMDPTYIRPLPDKKTLRTMRLQEFLCFLWVVGAAVLMAIGIVPYAFLPHAYATAVVIITLNALRTLGAHRWNNAGEEMTFVGQLLDSVNYPHRPYITELWGPVGTRYHSLHHLFGTIPYHNLGRAHRLLMDKLPADSSYRQTNTVTLTSTIIDLWKRALKYSAEEKTAAKQQKKDSRSRDRQNESSMAH